eukprot:symbB.v1.2.003379.t1/scaffold190.1/size276550/4
MAEIAIKYLALVDELVSKACESIDKALTCLCNQNVCLGDPMCYQQCKNEAPLCCGNCLACDLACLPCQSTEETTKWDFVNFPDEDIESFDQHSSSCPFAGLCIFHLHLRNAKCRGAVLRRNDVIKLKVAQRKLRFTARQLKDRKTAHFDIMAVRLDSVQQILKLKTGSCTSTLQVIDDPRGSYRVQNHCRRKGDHPEVRRHLDSAHEFAGDVRHALSTVALLDNLLKVSALRPHQGTV